RARKLVESHLSRAVKMVPASNGKVDSAVLLGLGLAVEYDIENRRTHHDGAHDHEHDDFDSFVIDLPDGIAADELADRITASAEADGVLRAKGFLNVPGKPMRLLV